MIGILKGHGVGLLLIGGIGQPGLVACIEAEGRSLILNDGFALAGGIVAVGNALVIGPHVQAETLSEFDVQLVGNGLDVALPVERGIGIVGDGSGAHGTHLAAAPYGGTVGQCQSDGRGLQQYFPVKADSQHQTAVVADGGHEPPVGRCHHLISGHRRAAACQCGE